MNKLEQLSEELANSCESYNYVWFFDKELVSLDGDFTLKDLKMIVGRWEKMVKEV
jgi:hypothetical protein